MGQEGAAFFGPAPPPPGIAATPLRVLNES
jgi:hypothetical protein